jgi:hypothetical protein
MTAVGCVSGGNTCGITTKWGKLNPYDFYEEILPLNVVPNAETSTHREPHF